MAGPTSNERSTMMGHEYNYQDDFRMQFPQQRMMVPQYQARVFPTAHTIDFEAGANYLHSKYLEAEIIKTFASKQELVAYVKNVLNDEEQCKIVINSAKPKAIYFQCERAGAFRTTVKDASKRQRVAYTKRNKCGYRLVANLYPPDKDKKKKKEIDDKLESEMWILRMINPKHNHAPEPPTGNKKKRAKMSRTLVEKPLPRTQYGNDVMYPQQQELQDPEVLAAMGPAAAAVAALQPQVDTIDPNVDPSVQEHDHAHMR